MQNTLEESQLSGALEQVKQWFPEEAAELEANKVDLIKYIRYGVEPMNGSPLLGLKFSSSPEDNLGQQVELTPCAEAVAFASFGVFCFVVSLLGVSITINDRVKQLVVRMFGGIPLNGLQISIQRIVEAKSAIQRATATFGLIGEFWNLGLLKGFIGILRNSMSWWGWAKLAIVAAAQVTAWIATEGAAFIAEAALFIMSAVGFIEPCIDAVKKCSNGICETLPA